MASITELLNALHQQVDEVVEKRLAEDKTEEIERVFESSIHATLLQLKRGADYRNFKELAMVEFLLRVARAGYTRDQVEPFVAGLSPVDFEFNSD